MYYSLIERLPPKNPMMHSVLSLYVHAASACAYAQIRAGNVNTRIVIIIIMSIPGWYDTMYVRNASIDHIFPIHVNY